MYEIMYSFQEGYFIIQIVCPYSNGEYIKTYKVTFDFIFAFTFDFSSFLI